MKAVAMNPRRREIGVVEHAAPRIGAPNQARVRILDVGVCGTDREICAFDYGTPPEGSEYLVIGHESLGEVVEVGSAATGLRPGDLVVPTVRRPCAVPGCITCGAARQDFCTTGEFVERGIKQAHGFMAEEIVEDARFLNIVPRALRELAVLVEPLTIAEKGLAQLASVQQRIPAPSRPGRALVIGAGPVGLLAAMALRQIGYETHVFARARGPNARTAVVEQIGATYLAGDDGGLEGAAKRIGNIDLIFEATGQSSVSFEAMKHLGVNGMLILTGVPAARQPQSIDTDLLMRNLVLKNQVVLGTVNAGTVDFEAAIRDLGRFSERWPAAVRALITGRHPIERARELLANAPRGIKDVVTFDAR
jgi:threonine dehydrogenase-like Zn-dependent dehydrogenase